MIDLTSSSPEPSPPELEVGFEDLRGSPVPSITLDYPGISSAAFKSGSSSSSPANDHKKRKSISPDIVFVGQSKRQEKSSSLDLLDKLMEGANQSQSQSQSQFSQPNSYSQSQMGSEIQQRSQTSMSQSQAVASSSNIGGAYGSSSSSGDENAGASRGANIGDADGSSSSSGNAGASRGAASSSMSNYNSPKDKEKADSPSKRSPEKLKCRYCSRTYAHKSTRSKHENHECDDHGSPAMIKKKKEQHASYKRDIAEEAEADRNQPLQEMKEVNHPHMASSSKYNYNSYNPSSSQSNSNTASYNMDDMDFESSMDSSMPSKNVPVRVPVVGGKKKPESYNYDMDMESSMESSMPMPSMKVNVPVAGAGAAGGKKKSGPKKKKKTEVEVVLDPNLEPKLLSRFQESLDAIDRPYRTSQCQTPGLIKFIRVEPTPTEDDDERKNRSVMRIAIIVIPEDNYLHLAESGKSNFTDLTYVEAYLQNLKDTLFQDLSSQTPNRIMFVVKGKPIENLILKHPDLKWKVTGLKSYLLLDHHIETVMNFSKLTKTASNPASKDTIDDIVDYVIKMTTKLEDGFKDNRIHEMGDKSKLKGSGGDGTGTRRRTPADAWNNMLRQIQGLSDKKVKSLLQYQNGRFSCPQKIMLEYEQAVRNGVEDGGASLLKNAFGGSQAELKLSQRIYLVLTCNDPERVHTA